METNNKSKSILIITTLVCLLPIILSLSMYDRLPDQVAVHWDIAGNPDNFMPKAVAAFVLPVSMAVLNLVVYVLISLDPKRNNAAPVLRMIAHWAIAALSVVIMPITLFKATGADIRIETVVPALVGVLILVIGNYLPKSKQNYTIGIKLPWTLHSEDNWNKTHRFAGYLWMVGGLLMVILAFLNTQAFWGMIIMILVLVAAPTIYSLSLYKKGV
ncbi:SdpI family protein [Paenibacillus sp. JCM 10914]|uniref:SdpI family protein n=1 Tax=Paenibacillus sp. JCM 10914 TaxID=1236974 RepID=UPI0003CC2C97|nr:SdpI family protein [Paenibacillus sp. JCM 10914]GAE07036.1 hypothetical protein JCM10914_3240 [Paenibacillus sp. JCM 10914]